MSLLTPNKPAGAPAPPVTAGEPADLIREYAFPVLVGILLALLVLGGVQLYQAHKRSVAERSSQLLSRARSAQELRELANLYPATPAAPIALLTLAAQHYRTGEYEQAQQIYRQFAQQYPDHPMKDMAEYGMISCMEASGLTEQALDAYTAFVSRSPAHFLAPQATFGRGRCLTQLGRLTEARAVYEDFIAAHPDSPWIIDAESLRLSVDQEVRGGRTRATPPPAAAVPEIPVEFSPSAAPFALPEAAAPAH
jgi:predicted negative regulator of RcsB-dependent stress response